MDKKVYCNNCDFFEEYFDEPNMTFEEYCHISGNTKVEYVSNHKEKEKIIIQKIKPQERNKDNNCSYYKPNIIEKIKMFFCKIFKR